MNLNVDAGEELELLAALEAYDSAADDEKRARNSKKAAVFRLTTLLEREGHLAAAETGDQLIVGGRPVASLRVSPVSVSKAKARTWAKKNPGAAEPFARVEETLDWVALATSDVAVEANLLAPKWLYPTAPRMDGN